MNKSELIDQISSDTGLPKKDATQALDSVFNKITEAMCQGEEVTLIGFGTFASKFRPERAGRNPQTGEAMTIKAAYLPNFRAGKALKEAVNKEMVAEA